MQNKKYPEKKWRNLSKNEKEDIIEWLECGSDVYKIAEHFDCSPSQPAGLEAWRKRNIGPTAETEDIILDSERSADSSTKQLFYLISPKTTFNDVILPRGTMENIQSALSQIENQKLIFEKWGLGKRINYGKSVSLNFFGPPGVGKTLTAEAIANKLGKPLMTVNYTWLNEYWIGNTQKNITNVFEQAKRYGAVLFFDEADGIISERTAVRSSADSTINQEKCVLLKELEDYEGVIIFSTNCPDYLDKAFERRITMHIEFEMPDKKSIIKIFESIIDKKTPISEDVDFEQLSKYEFSGGDIKNVILNAARFAASEKCEEIKMEHFQRACKLVNKAKDVFKGNKWDSIEDTNQLKSYIS